LDDQVRLNQQRLMSSDLGGANMQNKLRFWRLERLISQVALASISGVPRHVIQLAESGLHLPTDDQRRRLAASLGVPAQDLFVAEGSVAGHAMS
jgi:transcriptional regulator with XRE-family HTH domain